jgi:lysophospholipase L1-like esterase
VVGNAQLGCGLLATGSMELPDLNGVLSRQPVKGDCALEELWPSFLTRHRVSLAVIQFGLAEVADHQLPGDKQWRHVGDPVLDQALREPMSAAMETFTSRSIQVVWLAAPHIGLGRSIEPAVDHPMNDPDRIDRFNELVREAAATHPMVTVLDLPGYLAQLPGGEMDATVRLDGMHFSPESAATIADDWLGPELKKILG